MMVGLSEHQREAIAAYAALLSERPQLFAGRQSRPIVRDLRVIEDYSIQHGTVLGVAAETPYVWFIVDLVESRTRDGGVRRHPYLRVVSRVQAPQGVNVVVLATVADPALGRQGDIVLVEQERHSLGTVEIELPRGFGEPGLSGAENALRELEEETGYVGEKAHLLGSTCPDSGLADSCVSFFHVPVVRVSDAQPEVGEAISKIRLASREEIWTGIQSGTIRDGFTLQALALYERHAR